jgi:TolB-like protein
MKTSIIVAPGFVLAACVFQTAACGRIMKARARCAETLPVYHEADLPQRRFRSLGFHKDKKEEDLTWWACGEDADALIMRGPVSHSRPGFLWIPTEKILLAGEAIKFVDARGSQTSSRRPTRFAGDHGRKNAARTGGPAETGATAHEDTASSGGGQGIATKGGRDDSVSLALPSGRRRVVLVLPLKAKGDVAEHVSEILTNIMLTNLDQVQGLRTISANDIQATIQAERARDLLGCTDTSCLAEIGGALGADMVAYGAVGKLGSKLSVSVSMFDNRTSTVVARSAQVCDREEGLPDAAQLVVTDLISRADWVSRQ